MRYFSARLAIAVLSLSAMMLFELASSPGPSALAATDRYANVHTVAVISTVGSEIGLQEIGSIGFTGEKAGLRTDWDFDGQIVEGVKKTLGTRFTFAESDIDKAAFADRDLDFNNAREMKRRIQALPKVAGLDAYVIVTPSDVSILNMRWRGLSIVRFQGVFGSGQTSLNADYTVWVFNAADGSRIDYGSSQYPSKATLTGHEPPREICDNSLWVTNPDEASSEQKSRIRQEFESLLNRSISFTLASANLIDKAAAASIAATIAKPGDPSCHAGP